MVDGKRQTSKKKTELSTSVEMPTGPSTITEKKVIILAQRALSLS